MEQLLHSSSTRMFQTCTGHSRQRGRWRTGLINELVERNPPPARLATPYPIKAYERQLALEEEEEVLARPQEVGYTTRY